MSALLHSCIALLLVLLNGLLIWQLRLWSLLAIGFVSAGVVATFMVSGDGNLDAWLGLIKFLCVWMLGLGAIVGFSLLSKTRQAQYLGRFTTYINAAVLGNILMMALTPAGQTLRGLSSPLTCLLLALWLGLEMRRKNWQTVLFDRGIFLFNASPLPWIICHSIYRVGLISLPIFDSFRYLLLEPLSWLLMFLMRRLDGQRHPLCFYFGMADTVVVSTLAVSAKLLDATLGPYALPQTWQLSSDQLDLIVISSHVIVQLICLSKIWSLAREAAYTP